ncbi:PREDICTED: uncharacterized protein LOC104601467 [Nelumbo nucifera]|uniref:Uncharacterized protein LOC104601467 n=1 Tax=Nelumbo nucifera TaxID=4432 RepID=A0A1U8AL93_NELNU|nr:PREDICTED: uncharacterized protein LOC104601467 [Nelumbo nucifera]
MSPVMAVTENTKWLRVAFAIVATAFSASATISVLLFRRKSRDLNRRIRELEASLKASLEKCAAERQGRTRAQQALRKALTENNSDKFERTFYPMTPIAVVQSCFSTRNGTPRQPLLVPLARACLAFDSGQFPPAALEGLGEYSHCWILYVFHLNTDLEKLWNEPAKSKFKAKVRVPRLKGGRMGVFATRSPHRPCPIGLTVAKVEAVQGHMVLLSGVDLVDGTPVLDIKPYLPYCDSVQEATVPKWVTVDNMLAVASVSFSQEFSSTLANCWVKTEKRSLYESPGEFQSLIKEVLSWDIRSLSQRKRPHGCLLKMENHAVSNMNPEFEKDQDEDLGYENEQGSISSSNVIYHLILEGLDISYIIDCGGNAVVEKVTPSTNTQDNSRRCCNYMIWRDKLGPKTIVETATNT